MQMYYLNNGIRWSFLHVLPELIQTPFGVGLYYHKQQGKGIVGEVGDDAGPQRAGPLI